MMKEGTQMAMRAAVRVYCEQCDAEGPDGDGVGEARELAAMAGWMVGSAHYTSARMPDYCPLCRVGREFICEYPTGCKSDALYRYIMPDREISACGKHHAGMLRVLFDEHPEITEFNVQRLRRSRNYDKIAVA